MYILLSDLMFFTPQPELALVYSFHPRHPAGQTGGHTGGRVCGGNTLSGLDLIVTIKDRAFILGRDISKEVEVCNIIVWS